MFISKPRYRVVAERQRYDERDNVQSRNTLEPGTPDYDDFYLRHPEWKQKDDEIRALPGLGHVGSPLDLPLLGAQYEFLAKLGMQDRVDGPVNPDRQPISAERATVKIKGYATHLGADIVRVGPLNPLYVYTNVGKTWHDPARSFGQPIACRILAHRRNADAMGQGDLTQRERFEQVGHDATSWQRSGHFA
jgi:hypothetical protein